MATVKETSDCNKMDNKVDLDRILVEEIGEGRYQVKAVVLCSVITLLWGWALNDFIFYAERVKTRCKIEECEERDHTSFAPPWLSHAVPEFDHTFDNCHRFAPFNSWHASAEACLPNLFNKSSIVECTEYFYQHQNSAVYEFGLACDEWRWFLFGSSQLLGMMVSLPLAGFISDRWGRRFALSFTAFNCAWINAALYWINSYIVFIFVSFLGSVFGSACMTCGFTLALELVGPKRRMAVGSILATTVNIGSVLKGLLAWTQPYWRHFILMLYLPMLISIGYFWIAPESLRWLLSKNRFEESKAVLIKAAKMNGRVLSNETTKKLSEGTWESKTTDNEANLSLVFKYKTVLVRCIVISIWSLSSTFMIKGLVISSVIISGNKYANYCAVSAVSIPGYWAATLIINKVGRKPLLIGLFLLGGVCQLGYILIPKDSPGINLILYLLTTFCASAVQTSIVVYTAELFPTSHRSRLTAFTSIFGRVGGLIGLLTPALGERVWEHLPHALFSAMAFLSGLLVLLTPETVGTSLPDTMEDAARLGDEHRSWVRDLLRRLTAQDCGIHDSGVVLKKISTISF